MAYYKSFSINGKAVKALKLNGEAVKLQTIDHSAHPLRFTMTGGTMGDISFVFANAPGGLTINVTAYDGSNPEPIAGGSYSLTPEADTKYFLSSLVGIDHLEKGQYYEVSFPEIATGVVPTFNGSTSLDGTYEVTGNLGTLGTTGYGMGCYRLLFRGDTTITSAELYNDGTLGMFCYDAMFRNCTALKSFKGTLMNGTGIFEVPDYAFRNTFSGCTSLKSCSFCSFTGEPVIHDNTFAKTFYNCTSLETVDMSFVSGTYLGDQHANTECWQCASSCGYLQCFYNCEMLHGLRPVFLAMKNDLNGNYKQMFYRAGLGSSENLFTGPIYVGSASYYEDVGYTSYSDFTDVFKDAKVGEIVYPAAFEDDASFNAASGSPEFGARVTEITFRDVN